jgi:pyrophosphatase PpaX
LNGSPPDTRSETLQQPDRPPLRALLLDVDGTLVDTAGLLIRALRHTLTAHLGGTYTDEELRNLLGRPLRQQMEQFDAERASPMAADFLEYYEAHQDEEQGFEAALDLLPWVRERGILVCLVTSKSAPEMVITRGRFPRLFEVDAMVTSDETARVKPHPDPAILALRRLGVEASEAIMVGDSPYDIQCGHGAGVPVGAALWGPFPQSMLARCEPDYWLASPADIRALIATRLSTAR